MWSRAKLTPGAGEAVLLRPVARAHLAVIVTVLLWGYSAVVIKSVQADPLVMAFYRLWFAVPLLWLICLSVPGIRYGLDRSWLLGSLLGGGLFALHQVFFIHAMKATSVANVTIIGALQPALVLLVAGRFFGEYPRPRAVVWALVAFAGSGTVVLGSMGAPSVSLVGDALAAANLLAFTAYFLISRWVRSAVGAWPYVAGMTTVAGVVIAVAVLATGVNPGVATGRDLLLLLGLALLPGTLGHVLMNWAHAHASAFSISMILLAAPIIASAAAWIVLGEALSWSQVLGGLVVVGAIAAIVSSSSDPRAQEELAESGAETNAP